MSVLSTVKAVNRQLGNPLRAFSGAREFVEPRLRMRTFERDRAGRAHKYAAADFGFTAQAEVAQTIERDGYAVLRQVFEPTLLYEIYATVEAHANTGTALQRIAKDSARPKGDRREAQVHLTAEETARGQGYLRQHTNHVAIANPLITVPAVNELAFHSLLLDIAQTYLDCVPAVGGMNLRKSFRNELPEFDTLYFHVDPNSPKFLKFFFYLNDVDPTGGPFCYVRGSHRRRFKGWTKKGRWTPEEIEAAYGVFDVMYLTANVGDLIVADTNGFHRGTKISGADRTMLTLDFVVHPEFDGTQDWSLFQVSRQRLQQMTPRQRAAADFLQIVD